MSGQKGLSGCFRLFCWWWISWCFQHAKVVVGKQQWLDNATAADSGCCRFLQKKRAEWFNAPKEAVEEFQQEVRATEWPHVFPRPSETLHSLLNAEFITSYDTKSTVYMLFFRSAVLIAQLGFFANMPVAPSISCIPWARSLWPFVKTMLKSHCMHTHCLSSCIHQLISKISQVLQQNLARLRQCFFLVLASCSISESHSSGSPLPPFQFLDSCVPVPVLLIRA